jgi:hypothetical protein
MKEKTEKGDNVRKNWFDSVAFCKLRCVASNSITVASLFHARYPGCYVAARARLFLMGKIHKQEKGRKKQK